MTARLHKDRPLSGPRGLRRGREPCGADGVKAIMRALRGLCGLWALSVSLDGAPARSAPALASQQSVAVAARLVEGGRRFGYCGKMAVHGTFIFQVDATLAGAPPARRITVEVLCPGDQHCRGSAVVFKNGERYRLALTPLDRGAKRAGTTNEGQSADAAAPAAHFRATALCPINEAESRALAAELYRRGLAMAARDPAGALQAYEDSLRLNEVDEVRAAFQRLLATVGPM